MKTIEAYGLWTVGAVVVLYMGWFAALAGHIIGSSNMYQEVRDG